MSDLLQLAERVENTIGPDWDWLVRRKSPGYFANIFPKRSMSRQELTRYACPAVGMSPDVALLGALTIFEETNNDDN